VELHTTPQQKKLRLVAWGGITSPATGYLYLFDDQLFPLRSGKTIFLFGGIPVAANFTAEGAPIKTVQFYLDDVLINEDTTAPYSVTLNVRHSGPAIIKVTAIDILGRSASDTLKIDNYIHIGF
jgi:Bacterial Ig domain